MKKILAILTVVAFAAAAVPAVDASEVISADYDVPSGPTRLNNPATGGSIGPGVSTRLCAEEWDGGVLVAPEDDAAAAAACGAVRTAWADDGFKVGIFSAGIEADCGDCYTTFLVSVTDTLPADTFYSFCIITNYQDGRDGTDTWCGQDPSDEVGDDIEDPRTAGCGSASLSSAVPAGGEENGASAFVYASHVDETTGQVCLGSKGTLTVDMS